MKHSFLIDMEERYLLSGLMKDREKKEKFERNIKLNIMRYNQAKNPEDYDCRLYKKGDKYIIKVTKIDE